jgi:predicted hydrolase (HD superfamily)
MSEYGWMRPKLTDLRQNAIRKVATELRLRGTAAPTDNDIDAMVNAYCYHGDKDVTATSDALLDGTFAWKAFCKAVQREALRQTSEAQMLARFKEEAR